MKTKIFLYLSIVMGLVLASCNDDDDYFISTTPIMDDSSVVTGSADVTATTATLYGSVSGLEGLNSSAYTVGFYYGYDSSNLNQSVLGTYNSGSISATLTGLTNNTVLYYQAYVTLSGKVTFHGAVKSLVTTNAKVTTVSATAIDYAGATLSGTTELAPADATCGVVISTSSDVEAVRAGLIVAAASLQSSFSIAESGLMPNTHYYYAAYLDLGTGIIYGDVKDFTTATHEYNVDDDLVDLGLSVKWGKYNIGAKKETDLGGYYGFGDLTGVSNSIEPSDFASENVYKTAKDLVYKAYNGCATLPSAADYEELFSKCSKEWTSIDGVNGYKLTGPNGNSIFLPAAGSRVLNSVNGESTIGNYLTGTVNPSNSQYAVTFQFASGNNARSTTPVYQAMSVRPISTSRNVKFDRTLLYQKWYLDNGQDGKQHVFQGPFTQYGSSDNWKTVANGEPNLSQSIHWEMGTDNGWIGYTYGVDYGYMEFKEDGTVNIHRLTDDGTATDESGKYTIDETNKVIDIDINVLCANTWLSTKKGKLNILSLTSDGLQIALPDGDYGYSLNYYSESKRKTDAKIEVSLLCVGSDWAGTWGSTVAEISPEELNGSHTFTYEGSCNGAMVYTLDFVDLASKYPNAIVTITDIKCDGKSIPFDGSKFYYGDIEDNGKFRIQLYNIWGKGAVDGAVDSPFSNSGYLSADPAFNFASKLEITYYIMTDASSAFVPNLITINNDWGGTWGTPASQSLGIKLVDNQYVISNKSFDIKYSDTTQSGGSRMTFIEVADLYGLFPGTHATLDNIYLDGKELTGWDKTKVIDANESPKYRLELWNCYGTTGTTGCAFGTADGDIIKGLGFSSSMELKFTFHSLFASPW